MLLSLRVSHVQTKTDERNILKNLGKAAALDRALQSLSAHAPECRLCPRQCSVNRSEGEVGVCQSGNSARISHALLHFGEEPVLSGVPELGQIPEKRTVTQKGSGTLFFAGCSLKCVFCQNHQISWEGEGTWLSDSALADTMLELQNQGAANINLVSPSHVLLPILRALQIAMDGGLNLPIVYNSHGYELPSVLRSLEGIVDIYLPDFKYSSSQLAQSLSHAPDYFEKASAAILEMYCQQPVLDISGEGYARRGLIVRHLILPGQIQNTLRVLYWLAENVSLSIGLSLMRQFTPCFNTPAEFQKTLTSEEYQKVLKTAENLGFENIFIQPEPFAREENLTPDFSKQFPFSWGGTK